MDASSTAGVAGAVSRLQTQGAMIVHRDPSRQFDPAVELSRCLTMRVDDVEAITSRLLELGSLEAALTDGWTSDRDDIDARVGALSDATRCAARALIDAHESGGLERDGQAEQSLRRALSRCLRMPLPERLTCTVPEGFAYHGVHPLSYDEVVRADLRRHRPSRVLVVGLRTIGTTLAAVAAARCEREGVPARVVSVRPGGDAADRTCAVSVEWQREVSAQTGARCYVVDEGPGPSGTSLTSAAALLESLGHARDRIVIVCSHEPDVAALQSARARECWTRHARLVAPCRRRSFVEDWSGGQWRARRGWPARAWPPAHPQHERHKGVSAEDPDRLLKFVGLGPYGRVVCHRAAQAADAGFGVPVHGVQDGYLQMTWLARATSPGRRATPAIAAALLTYLPWRAATMQTGTRAEVGPLLRLLETNTRAHFGAQLDGGLAAALSAASRAPAQPAVIVDGHLSPWEWLMTSQGLIKVDTGEHGDDLFQPGPQDATWDVAAALTEFAWTRRERASLVEQMARRMRDPGLEGRLRWLQPCYLAARLGYAALAAESLAGSEEGGRFSRLRARYARQLARALHVA